MWSPGRSFHSTQATQARRSNNRDLEGLRAVRLQPPRSELPLGVPIPTHGWLAGARSCSEHADLLIHCTRFPLSRRDASPQVTGREGSEAEREGESMGEADELIGEWG